MDTKKIEIRNIHFNERKGHIYAEVWMNGELQCAALLDYCVKRAEALARPQFVRA